MLKRSWQQRSDSASQAMTAFAAFTLLLPTTWVHVALFLLVLFWVLGGNFEEKIHRIKLNPVALWAVGFFALFLLGVLHTSTAYPTAFKTLGKYHKLLYIPIIISALSAETWRYRAYMTLLVAILVNMALTYGIWAGLLPPGPIGQEYTLFKGRIAWPFFMAFGTFIMAHHFALEPKRRWIWGPLIVLGLYNIAYMNSGRTGQIIIISLILLFSFQQGRWRGFFIGTATAIALVAIGVTTSPIIQQRIQQETITLQNGQQPENSTSIRISYYKNTLRIIAAHPLVGGGTGSFPDNYRAIATQLNIPTTDNPHNEYLMITSQLGLVGFCIFLLMGYWQWRNTAFLPSPYREASQGLIIAMATGCLFNSFLLDHSEGYFYVIVSGILFSGITAHRTKTQSQLID